MKVLLLNASPKNHGATQEILITIQSQFTSDINSDIICLGDLNIKYCNGDKICYKTCKCIHDDDMEAIINILDNSDIIIIAAPSYWADISGQFKVFIDRCTPYSDTNPNPNHRVLKSDKKCYAISLRTGTHPIECEHIIDTINHWCGHMKIDMIDSMFFCEITDKHDISKYNNDIISKVKEWVK